MTTDSDGIQRIHKDMREVEFLEAFLMAIEELQVYFDVSGLTLEPAIYTGQADYSDIAANDYFNGVYAAYKLHGIQSDFPFIASSDALSLEGFAKVTKSWGLTNILATSREADFSDYQTYGNTLRMVASNSFGGRVIADVLDYFKWKRIAVFHSADTESVQTCQHIRDALNGSEQILFDHSVIDSSTFDYTSLLKQAQKSGATVFVFLVDTASTAQLLHYGSEIGLFNELTQVISSEYCGTDELLDYFRDIMNLTPDVIERNLLGFLTLKYNPRLSLPRSRYHHAPRLSHTRS